MKSDQDIFDYLDALLWAVAHGFLQFAPDGSAKCSSYCLTNDGCAANLQRPQENERSPRLSSQNIVAVDPDSLTVAPYPMSRPPDVIAPAHIITRAAIIIGLITNLDRDSAWVRAIARATNVTGAITGSITTPIIRSVTRARAGVILVFASA